MVKKFCPNCKEFSYSSAAEGKWICPICGTDLTKMPVKELDTSDLIVNNKENVTVLDKYRILKE